MKTKFLPSVVGAAVSLVLGITRETILTLLAALLLVVLPLTQAHVQTYQVLYSFRGGADGGTPFAGVVRDREGNLCGTAEAGGAPSAMQ